MLCNSSNAASSCSSDIALTPLLCSTFSSLGTRRAQIFMYAAGWFFRTFSIAWRPPLRKSSASASRNGLLKMRRDRWAFPPRGDGARCDHRPASDLTNGTIFPFKRDRSARQTRVAVLGGLAGDQCDGILRRHLSLTKNQPEIRVVSGILGLCADLISG